MRGSAFNAFITRSDKASGMSRVTRRDVPSRALHQSRVRLFHPSRYCECRSHPIESISPSHNGRSMRVPALIWPGSVLDKLKEVFRNIRLRQDCLPEFLVLGPRARMYRAVSGSSSQRGGLELISQASGSGYLRICQNGIYVIIGHVGTSIQSRSRNGSLSMDVEEPMLSGRV